MNEQQKAALRTAYQRLITYNCGYAEANKAGVALAAAFPEAAERRIGKRREPQTHFQQCVGGRRALGKGRTSRQALFVYVSRLGRRSTDPVVESRVIPEDLA